MGAIWDWLTGRSEKEHDVYANFDVVKQVITDLEEQKRVVIISSQEDVVSYFGLILQQYGQYNVYLEEDLSIVDDEYLEEVSKRDRPKEEAVTVTE